MGRMTKLDDVARAILKARFFDCEPEAYGGDLDRFYQELDADHMNEARDEARAAILAMREPTPEMVAKAEDADAEASELNLSKGGPGRGLDFYDVYRAMIDEALSE